MKRFGIQVRAQHDEVNRFRQFLNFVCCVNILQIFRCHRLFLSNFYESTEVIILRRAKHGVTCIVRLYYPQSKIRIGALLRLIEQLNLLHLADYLSGSKPRLETDASYHQTILPTTDDHIYVLSISFVTGFCNIGFNGVWDTCSPVSRC